MKDVNQALFLVSYGAGVVGVCLMYMVWADVQASYRVAAVMFAVGVFAGSASLLVGDGRE
jgi:hypothetical protein